MSHLLIQPDCRRWAEVLRGETAGPMLGTPLETWRAKTRRELGLADDVRIIATGHQTLLWHPGILVKYMLRDAVAAAQGLGRANLIVDQHASTPGGIGDFGGYEVPVKRSDGSLAVRRIELTRPRPEVPMALHEAMTPLAAPAGLVPADPAVAEGVGRIHAAIEAHADAPDAANQMAGALEDLMRPWVEPACRVTATDLVETTLGRALVRAMVDEPHRCAEIYNAAVAEVPEAGIGPLLVRDDYVELPLWRIREDGRRMHAYDGDATRWLEAGATAPRLMPRALLMTALVRLGMCDLFVHGTGGARYDRAMELWVERWLGVRPAPIAVASATLQLPLVPEARVRSSVAATRAAARRVWHDPEPVEPPGERGPGPAKRELLEAINDAKRRSAHRRAAFFTMHRELTVMRSAHAGRVELFQRRATEAVRRRADAAVADRRDWPFPLYPAEMLDALADEVAAAVGAEATEQGRE